MNDFQDNQLLRDYVCDASQTAFASLARRYAGLVFHVALRCTQSVELAEEATQNTFVILAKKSAGIDASGGLAPWLHRTVFFEASKLRDREMRYQKKISRMAEQVTLAPGEAEAWDGTAPILDAVLNELGPDDLHVILLRFYNGYSYQEIVRKFGSEEATWRKRCNRAVERLRERLANRGTHVNTVVLIAALSSLLPQSAPAALLEQVARPVVLASAKTGVFFMTSAKGITMATCLVVVTAGIVLSNVLREKPVQAASQTKPMDSAGKPEEPTEVNSNAVEQFDAEQRRAWLNAFREHLYERGAPHSNDLMPQIGGLGRSGRYGRGIGRSALHEFADRTGGDASEIIAILKEALASDRATVAYRALGYWGWVRDFAGADGAKSLIEFVGKTDNQSLAMYAMNILGQYEIDPETNMPARFIDLMANGTTNAKIALSYYGGGFAQRKGMEAIEEMLLPLLKNSDPTTRYAAARILSDFPSRRDHQMFAALLDIPSGLEDYHYKGTLADLLEMPVEASQPNREQLAEFLARLQSKPNASPEVYDALLKFNLADSQAATIETWKFEAAALTARKGDETLAMPDLIKSLENPLARAQALEEIRRIGPNAVEYRETLISLVEKFPLDEALANVAHCTDINAPHPSPWIDMRGMFPVLKSIDEALSASTDPAWATFRHDLDAWMIDEPKTNVTVARNLAADLEDVSPELRELFINKLHEHQARLAELAFGKVGK